MSWNDDYKPKRDQIADNNPRDSWIRKGKTGNPGKKILKDRLYSLIKRYRQYKEWGLEENLHCSWKIWDKWRISLIPKIRRAANTLLKKREKK